MNKKNFSSLLIALLVIYCIISLVPIWNSPYARQSDFRIYYYSAKLFFDGQNPYDMWLLCPIIKIAHWCAYAPAALSFYKPFLYFDFETATKVFLILKIILLVVLLTLWKKYFLKEDADLFFYFFCVFAFHSTFYIDLISGNINLLEQCLLWIGFYYFLIHRYVLFGAFVVAASSFKLAPVVFLWLYFLSDDPQKWKHFIIFNLLFVLYFLIQYAVNPYLFSQYVSRVIQTLPDSGRVCPATLPFLKDLFWLITKNFRTDLPAERMKELAHLVATGVTAIISITVILTTRKALNLLRSLSARDKDKIVLFLFCLLYALIHPRFKDYAYILLIVPSYYILKRSISFNFYPVILILPLLAFHSTLPGFRKLFPLLWEYYPLVIVYGIWSLYLVHIFRFKATYLTGEPKKEDHQT
ncbi:MAG: glycosyltransferase 87 family protein [Candidatus Omnitrophota bacterium]